MFANHDDGSEKLLLIYEDLVSVVLNLERRCMSWGDIASEKELRICGIDLSTRFTFGTGTENILESNEWFLADRSLAEIHEHALYPRSLDAPFLLVKGSPTIVCYIKHPLQSVLSSQWSSTLLNLSL